MNRAVLVAASWLLLAHLLAAQDGASGFQSLTVPAALTQAAAQHRLVLIDFSTTACEPCRRLAETTWRDAGVLEWLGAHTIAIRVDPEQEHDLAKAHRIDAYPTIVVLGEDEKEQGRILGYLDATAMRQRLDEVLEGRSTDWKTRERLGDRLSAQGDKEGALRHYLWCWDHGLEHNPAMAGVRGSFFVAKLTEFAGSFAPARAALEARRDAAEAKVGQGHTGFAIVSDVVQLNEGLGTRSRLLDLLVKTPQARWRRNEVARRVLFEAVLDDLTEARRYADILQFGGDLTRAFERDVGFLKMGMMPADVRSHNVHKIVTQYAQIVEAYFGKREDEAALALVDKLLELDGSAATWVLLMDAAKRAGNPVASQDLATRALQELPPNEQATIRLALQKK